MMRPICIFVILVVSVAALVNCQRGVTNTPPPAQAKQETATEILNRGLQAHTNGKLGEARTAYHQVLVQEPQNKYAFYNLGLIEQAQGSSIAAESYFRLALSTDPDFVPALYNLALLRAADGDTAESIQLLRHTIILDTNNPGAHFNLGVLLRSVGQQTEGDDEIRKAFELNPDLKIGTPTP